VWRSSTLSSFLKIFIWIFSVETIVFGLCVLAADVSMWPAAYAEYKLPVTLPITVAIFSILVYLVAQTKVVGQMMKIADRYFDTGERGQASPFSRGSPVVDTPSELGNQLRPDRDHPDEQRNRRQCRSLFHEYLQHTRLLIWEHKKNIVPFLFRMQEVSKGRFAACATMVNRPPRQIKSPGRSRGC